jgi:hypothetical protein
MDRDEYLRRASALEKRAADFVYPGLRTATQHSGAISQSRQSNSGQQSGRRVPRERAPSRPKGAIRVSRLSLRTLTPLPCAATDRFRQIDAARKSQMAALATINPHKTTMARLLFTQWPPHQQRFAHAETPPRLSRGARCAARFRGAN